MLEKGNEDAAKRHDFCCPARMARCTIALRALPLLGITLAPCGPAAAADGSRDSRLVFGTGWYDWHRRRDEAVEGRLEYRASGHQSRLQAVVAAHATSDGGVFVGTGLGYKLPLGRFDLTPTFVPGVYHRGRGFDLGHPLEFRSQVELGYRVSRASRLTVAFSHLSNGGLGSSNPGQESVTIGAEVRLGRQQPD